MLDWQKTREGAFENQDLTRLIGGKYFQVFPITKNADISYILSWCYFVRMTAEWITKNMSKSVWIFGFVKYQLSL